MVKTKLITLLILLCSLNLGAQEYSWSTVPMDGSRVGASIPNRDNVDEALGTVRLIKYRAPKGEKYRVLQELVESFGGVYYAPNGKKYRGMVADVAKLMIEAQPALYSVKEKIGYADHDMLLSGPECELSNMIVDCIMSAVERETGRKVDAGLSNFGGIRTEIRKGDVILDHIVSMLPFKNHVCYVALKGSDLRSLFEQLASVKMEVVGGVKLVVEDGRLASAEINGEPLDDDKVYGLATIDFLLNGGDHIFASRNAQELIQTEVLIRDAVLQFIKELTDEGKPVGYKVDGRVKIL